MPSVDIQLIQYIAWECHLNYITINFIADWTLLLILFEILIVSICQFILLQNPKLTLNINN
jgi:hypothetical protein